jgi:hypothetical protein
MCDCETVRDRVRAEAAAQRGLALDQLGSDMDAARNEHLVSLAEAWADTIRGKPTSANRKTLEEALWAKRDLHIAEMGATAVRRLDAIDKLFRATLRGAQWCGDCA